MASNAVIGALRVVLGADTAALESGLKDAQAKIAGFGSAVAKQTAMAAAAFATVGLGVALAVKGSIDEADKLGKAAQKWGVGVEELSRLKHAADLSGVSFDGLGTAVSRLSRNMSEVAGGATNTASKAFEALGISVKNSDGTLKSSTQVMTEIAAKFERFEDSAAKTALAMALFGRSGAELIPMLNAGATGMREMMTEADQLGIVIDSKTAKAAEAFNDNLTRLARVKDGIVTQIAARLLPALQNLSQIMIDAAKNSALMDATAKTLTVTLQGLITVAVAIGAAFKVAAGNIMAVASALMQAARGDFSGAWETLKTGVTDAVSTIQGAVSIIGNIWKAPADQNAAAAPELAKKIAAPIIQAADKAKEAMKALDAFFLQGTKNRAKMQADLETIGLSAGAHEKLKYELQALNIAKEKQIPLTDALREKIKAEAEATGQLADRLEDTKERYQDFKSSVMQVRSAMEGTFVDAVTGAKKLSDALKDLLKDLAKIAAQIAFRSLFGSTGDWGNLAGSLFRSAGGVQAGGVEGFATGGSFKVGGAGGMDSQLRALRLTPGERVTVTKGNEGFGAPGVTIVQHNDFRGADPGSESRIRAGLIAMKNQAVKEAVAAVANQRSLNPAYLRV